MLVRIRLIFIWIDRRHAHYCSDISQEAKMLYAGYGTVNVAAEADDRYWGEGGGVMEHAHVGALIVGLDCFNW